uniref:Longin domain-containing protein n=1 Tax=Pyrodinium bahamense TaxID=73915 RepID=A0A7S0FFK3_9DINO
MGGWGDKKLPFLAVGRVRPEPVCLAYHFATSTNEQRDQTMEVFRKLLQAAQNKLQKGERTRLQWNDGSVCCLMDEDGVVLYCVLTSSLAYPERPAYKLLNDLMTEVQKLGEIETATEHSLNQQLQQQMGQLLSQYEDPQMPLESLVPGTPASEAAVAAVSRGKRQMTIYMVLVAALVLVIFLISQVMRSSN